MVRAALGLAGIAIIVFAGWTYYHEWSERAMDLEMYKSWIAGRSTVTGDTRERVREANIEITKVKMQTGATAAGGMALIILGAIWRPGRASTTMRTSPQAAERGG